MLGCGCVLVRFAISSCELLHVHERLYPETSSFHTFPFAFLAKSDLMPWALALSALAPSPRETFLVRKRKLVGTRFAGNRPTTLHPV